MVVQYAGTVNLSVITLDQDSAKNHDISKWSLFLGCNQINRKVGQHMNNAQFYDRLYNASGIYCFFNFFPTSLAIFKGEAVLFVQTNVYKIALIRSHYRTSK